MTNDPYRGGSHLPDVTVITPVHELATGKLLFFTASRAHHAEIGGLAPGSMPPFSRSLAEEGVLIRNFHLMAPSRRKRAAAPIRSAALGRIGRSASRRPIHRATWPRIWPIWPLRSPPIGRRARSGALAELQSLALVLRYMDHIQAAAEQKMSRALAGVGDGAIGSPTNSTTARRSRSRLHLRMAGPFRFQRVPGRSCPRQLERQPGDCRPRR